MDCTFFYRRQCLSRFLYRQPPHRDQQISDISIKLVVAYGKTNRHIFLRLSASNGESCCTVSYVYECVDVVKGLHFNSAGKVLGVKSLIVSDGRWQRRRQQHSPENSSSGAHRLYGLLFQSDVVVVVVVVCWPWPVQWSVSTVSRYKAYLCRKRVWRDTTKSRVPIYNLSVLGSRLELEAKRKVSTTTSASSANVLVV